MYKSSIRADEQKLLEFALERVPIERWRGCRIGLFAKVTRNTVVNPFLQDKVIPGIFCASLFSQKESERSMAYNIARRNGVNLEEVKDSISMLLQS